MRIFLLGFQDSHIYDKTTALELASEGNFIFRNGLQKNDHYCSEDVLIRYGNYSYPSYDKQFGKVINKATSIFRNINKLETHLKLFKEGLRVPRIFFSKDQIENKDFPIVRRNINHSRASDVLIINNRNNFAEGSYYTEYIPNEEEYRLHILFNQCCRVSKKVPSENEEQISAKIKSSSTGWTLIDKFKMNVKALREAISMCIKALKILELEFGACDVVVNESTNLPYLLEVNSCPRLSPYGRRLYIKEFYEYLGLPTDRLNTKKIIDWEFKDIIPIKYRKGQRKKPTKAEFGL